MKKKNATPKPGWMRTGILLALLALAAPWAAANTPLDITAALQALSIEELADIRITSVSKHGERLADAAAAVFVISREDVRRSGATSLPEILRLAPNLQVARLGANRHAVSARGFNDVFATKLLVMIDGRSIYGTLSSGVFWDMHDVLPADIERIEVVSGPGGTLWGANAVNGVINIITQSARDTPGGLAVLQAGRDERGAAARHAVALGGDAAVRAYAKHFTRDPSANAAGAYARDGWHRGQAGFRADWAGSADTVTFQGDIYQGSVDPGSGQDIDISGGNLLARWQHARPAGNEYTVQAYVDHMRRQRPAFFTQAFSAFDLELLARLRAIAGHDLTCGVSYRLSPDHLDFRPAANQRFIPERRRLTLAGVFVQDALSLAPAVTLTAGAKVERNTYTGTELQPNLRLAWKPAGEQLLWAAASRAIRIPSRADFDRYVPFSPPFTLTPGTDAAPERVTALEAGWRAQPAAGVSVSVSAYHNRYRGLRSVQGAINASGIVANRADGRTVGLEAWGSWQAAAAWRLTAGFQRLQRRLTAGPASSTANPFGNDAGRVVQLRSALDITPRIEFDVALRHVGALPSPRIDAYTAADARIGWRPTAALEVSLSGQNLGGRHQEFAPAPGLSVRSVYGPAGMVEVRVGF